MSAAESGYPSMISVEISMILDRVFLPHMYQILENLAKGKYLKQATSKNFDLLIPPYQQRCYQ